MISTPTAVAYFVVRVPLNTSSVRHEGQAKDIVKAYLYAGAEIVNVELDVDDFSNLTFEVLVRVETYGGNDINYIVRYQRDRLSSGMYSSTEPQVALVKVGV